MDVVRKAVVYLFAFSLFCFLLFLLPTGDIDLFGFILFLLTSASFLLGFAFCFDDAVSGRARMAISYLALVAYIHLWTESLVIKSSWATVLLIYEATEPLSELVRSVWTYAPSWLSDGIVGSSNWRADDLSGAAAIFATALSLVALASTIALARRKQVGYVFWFTLVGFSTAASLRILLASAMAPGHAQTVYGDGFWPSPWWTTFWPVTCAFACWIAWADSRP